MRKRTKRAIDSRRRMIRALTILLCVLLLILGSGIFYVYNLLGKIQHNPLVKDSEEVNSKPGKKMTPEDLGITKETQEELKKTGVINVLLFGLDSRKPGERARSDSIMIASLDTKKKVIKLTSLMRDTYLSIPDRQDNRINAAYAFGGPSLAIRTVNENYNMNIEKYVTVDFFSLEKIINRLGGVEIEVKSNEIKALNGLISNLNNLNKGDQDAPLIQSAGLQRLSGRQAVAYSRIRSVGNSDFGRTDRQRKVLTALAKQAKGANIWEVPDILSDLFPEIETNFTSNEILKLSVVGLEAVGRDIEQLRLPAEGTYEQRRIRGMAVLVPDMEKNRQILREFIYGEKE
ncbi:MAG: LCP family protein [Clostridiales bacterium]|nr:LCP family protein [Clostridiales bacterium]